MAVHNVEEAARCTVRRGCTERLYITGFVQFTRCNTTPKGVVTIILFYFLPKTCHYAKYSPATVRYFSAARLRENQRYINGTFIISVLICCV